MTEIIATETNQPEQHSEEFWKMHVSQAQNFMGTNKEYCRRNGLRPSTFHGYKKKLEGGTEPKRDKKAFIKVERKETPAREFVGSKQSTNASSLPDPKWMAKFVTALMAER